MKRTWRRRTIEIAACLGAGVVLSVAAGWACALWTPPPRTAPFRVIGIIERDGNPRPMPQTVAGSGFGFHVEMDKHIAWVDPGALGMRSDADRIAAGWPFLALECEVVYGPHTPAGHFGAAERIGSSVEEGPWLVDGISVLQARWLHARPWRFLPLRPRVAGFAANAMIVAILMWLAAFGWRDARALIRIRRGRCVGCGYPIAGLERCPECGRESVLARVLAEIRRWMRRGRCGEGLAPLWGSDFTPGALRGLTPPATGWRRFAAEEGGS